MKAIVGLLIFICIAVIAIYLRVNKKIENPMSIILLAFSIISGLAAANYDILKSAKFWGASFETYKDKVSGLEKESLKDIKKKVDVHKESIQFLIRDSNKTAKRLEKVIDIATALQGEIEKQMINR